MMTVLADLAGGSRAMLAGLGLAAAAAIAVDDSDFVPPPSPPPPGWPAWSWDSPRGMLFYHSGNESGFYSPASISKMASYAVVTMEKFNGEKWTGAGRPAQFKYDEDLMVEELRRVDAANYVFAL